MVRDEPACAGERGPAGLGGGGADLDFEGEVKGDMRCGVWELVEEDRAGDWMDSSGGERGGSAVILFQRDGLVVEKLK